jgi:hypothetical protein
VAGNSYRFRVRAHNNHGWAAAWSAETVVVAASTPDAPTAVVTSIENIYVRIYWDEPSGNSAALDGYDVYIAKSDGTMRLESTYCDGFTTASILSDHYCLVPMTVLLGTDYGLVRGDLVRAQVKAHNLYGYGTLSPVNTAGVLV